jgi:CheY-like chemotaxis protein
MLGTILLVEDDLEIRAALSAILRNEGYAVTCAADGRDALDQLEQGTRPEVILLDLMMPVMGGVEFRLRQLQDPRFARIPVIVLTADGRYREAGESLRAAATFPKPFEIEALLSAISRLDGAGSQGALA